MARRVSRWAAARAAAGAVVSLWTWRRTGRSPAGAQASPNPNPSPSPSPNSNSNPNPNPDHDPNPDSNSNPNPDPDPDPNWGAGLLTSIELNTLSILAALPTAAAPQAVCFEAGSDSKLLSVGAESALYHWSVTGSLLKRAPCLSP